MSTTRRGIAMMALSLLFAGRSGVALADATKAECVDADTQAQTLRRGEQFRAARELLERCSKPDCPKLVRADCAQRLSELDDATPTLVFEAKDAAGDDVLAVRVTMDGAPVAEKLAGVALMVEPGVHSFTFETDGVAPIEKQIVVHEGDKGRHERVTFKTLNLPPGRGALAVPPVQKPEAATSGSWSTQKSLAVVAGGLGVVGVVVGAVLGAQSFSSWSSSQSECGTTSCPDRAKALSDHNAALTDATVSDIGFIAGGVLVASGVALFLTAPSRSAHAAGATALRVLPSVVPGSSRTARTGIALEGRF